MFKTNLKFTPNYTAQYKCKDDALMGILNSFINVPGAADKEGNIIFLLGDHRLKIKPNKKKKKEESEDEE